MLASPVEGPLRLVCFDAVTLRHFNAEEWAPSTASKADVAVSGFDLCSSATSRHPLRVMMTPHVERNDRGTVVGPISGARSFQTTD